MKRFSFLPVVFGGVLCFSLLAAPQQSCAQTLTQRDYIKWMVQLSCCTRLFDAMSTDDDYLKWAHKQGMKPKQSQKGWDMDAAVSQNLLAETLAQFFDLGKPKKGNDYVLLLAREGITVPDMEFITQEAWIQLVDDFGFNSRTWWIAHCCVSPIKPAPKPPKPPKVKDHKNPPFHTPPGHTKWWTGWW